MAKAPQFANGVNDGWLDAQLRQIPDHIGMHSEAARMSPARGPPLWRDFDEQVGEGVQTERDKEMAARPAPDFDADQRVNCRRWDAKRITS